MKNMKWIENWGKVKKELMERYPSLTKTDFDEEDEEKQLQHLEQKLGKTKEEIRTIVKEIQEGQQ